MHPQKNNQKHRFRHTYKQKFWIQNCQEIKPQKHQLIGAMEIIITRSDTRDDFLPQTQSLPSIPNEDKNNLEMKQETNTISTEIDKDSVTNQADEQNVETMVSKMKKNKCDTNETKEDVDNGSPCIDINHKVTNEATNNGQAIQKKIETLKELSSKLITKMDNVDERLLTKEQIKQFHKVKSFSAAVTTGCTDNSNENHDPLKSLPSNQKERENVNDLIPFNTRTSSANVTSSKPDLRLPFIRIIRSESATKKVKGAKKLRYQPHLPHGDCGDGVKNPYPNTEVADKYWAQRKRLFSKFDEGILLDKESWYSVTPEAIADHLAKRFINFLHSSKNNNDHDSSRGKIVMDPFCGCGGNVIAFAKNCGITDSKDISLTVCVDHDIEKLKMAATNASVYNVDVNKIIFIHADAIFVMKFCFRNGENILNENHEDQGYNKEMEIYKGYKIGGVNALPKHIDAIFLSPPWGGPEYLYNGGESGGFHIKNDIQITSPLSLSVNSNLKTLQSKDCIQKSDRTIDGEDLMTIAANASNHKKVVFFLPRNLDGVSFGRVALKAGYRGNMEMEQNMLNGKLKTITVYLGKDNTDLLGTST